MGDDTKDHEDPQQQMVLQSTDPLASITGAYRQASTISQRMRWAEDNAILISPSTICTNVPDGHNVSLTAVRIDEKTDTHDVGGKRALLKHALFNLADAAGLCFDPDPKASGRIDDGSDPNYVHWHAAGALQNLDGTVIPADGDCEMDLRDGSAQVAKIFESIKVYDHYKKADRTPEEVYEIGRVQLRDTRAKILRHAQTKAQLAAIRKHLKIRSYTSDELEKKAFIVARLSYDGHDSNPEIERENKRVIRDLALGGARRLFGPRGGDSFAPRLLEAAPARGHAPPAVGTVPADRDSDGDITTSGTEIEPPGESIPVATAPARAPAPRAAPPQDAPFTPPPATSAPRGAKSGGKFPKFGRRKDEPLSAGSIADLQWYEGAIAKSVDDPDRARFRAANQKLLLEIRAELAAKRGGGAPVPAQQPPKPAARSYDDPYPSERDDDRGDDGGGPDDPSDPGRW